MANEGGPVTGDVISLEILSIISIVLAPWRGARASRILSASTSDMGRPASSSIIGACSRRFRAGQSAGRRQAGDEGRQAKAGRNLTGPLLAINQSERHIVASKLV